MKVLSRCGLKTRLRSRHQTVFGSTSSLHSRVLEMLPAAGSQRRFSVAFNKEKLRRVTTLDDFSDWRNTDAGDHPRNVRADDDELIFLAAMQGLIRFSARPDRKAILIDPS